MTPMRPTEPTRSTEPKGAPQPANTGSAPAAAAVAMPAPPSSAPEPASPIQRAVPTGLPSDAAVADVAAPRARRNSRRDRAAGGIRPGRWEFTVRLQTPASVSLPTPVSTTAAPEAVGGMQTTYTTCIEADNAVPADLGPQCRLERHDRRGSQVSWSMSCANTGVRSDGRARYRGETMQATVISRIPGAAGTLTGMTQHLTGRHLGPCLPSAGILPSGAPPVPDPATIDRTAAQRTWVEPPPTSPAAPPDGRTAPPLSPLIAGSTKPPAAVAERPPIVESAPEPRLESSSRVERSSRQVRRGRHARHARRGYRHHHARAWYGTSTASFGPSPYSSKVD
jgi:hypothetical protein